jgi:hypothetical protein
MLSIAPKQCDLGQGQAGLFEKNRGGQKYITFYPPPLDPDAGPSPDFNRRYDRWEATSLRKIASLRRASTRLTTPTMTSFHMAMGIRTS